MKRGRTELLPLAFVLLIVPAVYARTLAFPFVDWDDLDLVVSNPVVGPAWHSSWTGPVLGLYTPLSYTLWAAWAGLFGKSASAFHALNILLHTTATAVCYHLILRLISGHETPSTTHRWSAAVAALFWGLHPLKVEPVAWVSGMNNLLAGLLSLAALATVRTDLGDPSRPGTWRFVRATAWYALALLAKPTAIVVPLMATVLSGRSALSRTGALKLALWLAMAGGIGLVARDAQPDDASVTPGPLARLVIAADALGWHARSVLWPWPLTVDHGRTPEAVLTALQNGAAGHAVLGAVLLLVGLMAAIRRVPMAVPIGLFVAGLATNLGLQPFAFQEISTVADRYAYLALLGPAIGLARAFTALSHRLPRLAAAGGLALVLLLAFITWRGLTPWANSRDLFNHALAVNPRSALAYRVLGFIASREGRDTDAETLYRRSLDLRPGNAMTRFNLGNLYHRRGDLPAAFEQFSLASQSTAADVRSRALVNRGIVFELTARPVDALRDYEAALATDPRNASGLSNLANLLERRGDLTQARDLYRRALEVDPTLGPALRGLQRLGTP